MPHLQERLRSTLANRYVVEREIGRGGMATVYLAHDSSTAARSRSRCCIPISPPLGAERFLREIQIAARLQHPHILPLHDSGRGDGLLYYVMPYRRGRVAARPARPRDGRCPSTRRCASRARSPARSPTRTGTASCTATSSPRTSCCTRAGDRDRLRHRQGDERGGAATV